LDNVQSLAISSSEKSSGNAIGRYRCLQGTVHIRVEMCNSGWSSYKRFNDVPGCG
jgi:hypothetical protein